MTNTKLINKHFSPAIIRKYNILGFPLYIHLICDEDLNDLDFIVNNFISTNNILDETKIQSLRNFTGLLSEYLIDHYDSKKTGCVESCAVILYADKILISSLFGDVMNHKMCRDELYQSLILMTQI